MNNSINKEKPNRILALIFYIAIYGSSIRKKILATLLISIVLYFVYNNFN